jgi:hypothetical protein
MLLKIILNAYGYPKGSITQISAYENMQFILPHQAIVVFVWSGVNMRKEEQERTQACNSRH